MKIRWQMVREEGPEVAPFKDAGDVATYLIRQGYADRDREAFIVLLLDVKHRVIAEEVVTIGILDGALIHPREVFKAAVAGSAAADHRCAQSPERRSEAERTGCRGHKAIAQGRRSSWEFPWWIT